MKKSWYVYFYRSDSSSEPIGRIQACSIDEARIYIAAIKRLNIEEFDRVFIVKSSNSGKRNGSIL